MIRKMMLIAIVVCAANSSLSTAKAQQGYQTGTVPYAAPISQGQATSGYGVAQPSDWQRFYHYPYVYYPHSFQKPQQYNNMYYKYPQSMQIPVYNKNWYNFYPSEKPYHSGHHFLLDIF